MEVEEDAVSGGWVAPFFMAPMNTKHIHRSNALLGHAYGENFVYDEMFLTRLGEGGKKAADAMAAMSRVVNSSGGEEASKGRRRRAEFGCRRPHRARL